MITGHGKGKTTTARANHPCYIWSLTGLDAHPEVIEHGDTVSEIIEIKLAYRKGIEPRPGIDY